MTADARVVEKSSNPECQMSDIIDSDNAHKNFSASHCLHNSCRTSPFPRLFECRKPTVAQNETDERNKLDMFMNNND